jgi:cadmium resistance protein CadD (predicted permease)
VDEQPETAAAGGTAAIAATQLSNGVDTVLVFAPLLADSSFLFDVEIAVLFLLLVMLWFLLARVLSHRVSRLTVISRLGHWLAPLVMIGVGLYILSDTATDMV